MPTYTYSLSVDFGGTIALKQFHIAILNDVTIVQTLNSVEQSGDDIYVTFASDLSAGELTALNNLVVSFSAAASNAIQQTHYASYYESLAEIQTNSEKWAQKASFTSPYYEEETCVRIDWYYRYGANTHDRIVEFRVQLNNTTTLDLVSKNLGYNDIAQRQIQCGFWVGCVGQGTHTIDFDLRTSDSFKIVVMSDIRMSISYF